MHVSLRLYPSTTRSALLILICKYAYSCFDVYCVVQLTQYVGVLRLMKAPAAQVSAKLLSAHRTRSLRMIHAFKQSLLQSQAQQPSSASAVGDESGKNTVAGERFVKPFLCRRSNVVCCLYHRIVFTMSVRVCALFLQMGSPRRVNFTKA